MDVKKITLLMLASKKTGSFHETTMVAKAPLTRLAEMEERSLSRDRVRAKNIGRSSIYTVVKRSNFGEFTFQP